MWYVILLFLPHVQLQTTPGDTNKNRASEIWRWKQRQTTPPVKWLIVSFVITDSRQVTYQINKYNKAPKKTDHWQELRADSCAQSDEPIIRLSTTTEKRRPAVQMTVRHLRRATAEASSNTPRCCFAVDNQNSSERVQAVVVIDATASSFWVVHRGGPRGWMLKQVRDWLIYTCAHISTGGINKWNWGSHIWQKQMCYLSLALEASGRNRIATRMCVSKLCTLAQLCFCKRFQLQTWNVFWCWLFYCFTWSQVCSSHTACEALCCRTVTLHSTSSASKRIWISNI